MRCFKLLTAIFALTSTAATAGCVNVAYQTTAFRCNPRSGDDACPKGYQCCSDDPTVGVNNFPLFSGDQNDASANGMCVDELTMAGLTNGCPIPCNPEWSANEKEAVCGSPAMALCCQTAELDPKDCIFDTGVGDGGCFRPATGSDTSPVPDCPVGDLQVRLSTVGRDQELARCNSNWANSAHVTHQDPGVAAAGSACNGYAAQGASTFDDCVASLGVANTRGFCLAKSPDVMVCPTDLTNEEKLANGIPLDACTQLNIEMNFGGCL